MKSKEPPGSYSEYLDYQEVEKEQWVDEFDERKCLDETPEELTKNTYKLITEIDNAIFDLRLKYNVEKTLQRIILVNPKTLDNIKEMLANSITACKRDYFLPKTNIYKGFFIYTSVDVEPNQFKVLIG